MKIKCKIQHSLVVSHMAEDDGNFVFVICRRGFEKTLGRRCKVGDTVIVDVTFRQEMSNE